MARDFVLLQQSVAAGQLGAMQTYLFQRHAVLDQQRYPRVEIAHVFFEDEVLLRLRRDLGLEFAQYLLGCLQLAAAAHHGTRASIPRARSSSISSSLSLADMDRYSAVTEYRFDWRTEREPSCEDIVFWRETGMKDDEEDDDAREGACSIETAMLESLGYGAVAHPRLYLAMGGRLAAVLCARRVVSPAKLQRGRPSSETAGRRVCAAMAEDREITTGRQTWFAAAEWWAERRCGEGGNGTERGRESMGGQACVCVRRSGCRRTVAEAAREREVRAKERQTDKARVVVPAGNGDGGIAAVGHNTTAMGRFSFRESHRLRLRSANKWARDGQKQHLFCTKCGEEQASQANSHACTSVACRHGLIVLIQRLFLIASPCVAQHGKLGTRRSTRVAHTHTHGSEHTL
jgi:hypothetical protein